MIRTIAGGMLVLALVLAGCDRGPDAQGGAQGNGATEAVRVDLSTPQNTVRSFAAAINAGDAAAARRCVVDPTPEMERMTDATIQMFAALDQLEAAAVQAFGEAGRAVTGQEMSSAREMFAGIDAAQVTVDGQTATVRIEEQEPIILRQVNGEWKIDLAANMPAQAEVEQAISVMQAMATAARQTTEEIKGGQHPTAEAANQALGRRMMAAMFGGPDQ